MRSRSVLRFIGPALTLISATLVHSPPARACGGCFHEPQPNENASVVTDHRMAFSLSMTQTVLWDQIRYQGSPASFAWVLPVGQGAYIQVARDEWLAALDAISAPSIFAPVVSCPGNQGGGGIGCGAADNASLAMDGGTDATSGGVQVISQDVVGPYDAVTIRASSGEAITTWLTTNGYAIPPSIQPILDAYTSEGFDFIALKLAPNQGVQAMQPVRVITPGADPTLPLRMVAAGVGASVGLTLFVVSEGRYESKNFPSLLIDRSKIVWDPYALHSNYAQLFDDTVNAGQGWVTEFAGSAGQLSNLYGSTCIGKPQVAIPCDVGDAGASDAAVEAGGDAAASDAAADGASDAASSDAGPCVQYVSACQLFDDYTVATTGMSPYDVKVTRLRTTLPPAALAVDLKIGASADQSQLTNIIQAAGYTDPKYDPCGPPSSTNKTGCGCDTSGQDRAVTVTSFGILALAALARRRRRPRDV